MEKWPFVSLGKSSFRRKGVKSEISTWNYYPAVTERRNYQKCFNGVQSSLKRRMYMCKWQMWKRCAECSQWHPICSSHCGMAAALALVRVSNEIWKLFSKFIIKHCYNCYFIFSIYSWTNVFKNKFRSQSLFITSFRGETKFHFFFRALVSWPVFCQNL